MLPFRSPFHENLKKKLKVFFLSFRFMLFGMNSEMQWILRDFIFYEINKFEKQKKNLNQRN